MTRDETVAGRDKSYLRHALHPFSLGTRGYIVDPHIWEAVVPEWIVADGKVRDLVLHPVTLGQKDSRSQRGLPRLAEGDEAKAILSHLKDLSEPYGTKIQAENGVGRVKLGIKE